MPMNLKECGIKTGCRFEIKGEYGLPVFIRHCSSKKAYIAGILLFSGFNVHNVVVYMDSKGKRQ